MDAAARAPHPAAPHASGEARECVLLPLHTRHDCTHDFVWSSRKRSNKIQLERSRGNSARPGNIWAWLGSEDRGSCTALARMSPEEATGKHLCAPLPAMRSY